MINQLTQAVIYLIAMTDHLFLQKNIKIFIISLDSFLFMFNFSGEYAQLLFIYLFIY